MVSGRDGTVIQQLVVPDARESYYSPVIYSKKNGAKTVLFGTGGETHAGALWVIDLDDLLAGNIDKVIFIMAVGTALNKTSSKGLLRFL